MGKAPTAGLTRKYCTIEDWIFISGMGRRVTYDALGRGDLKAVKVGKRTLINCEAGLAWMAAQPAAVIKPMRRKPSLPRPARALDSVEDEIRMAEDIMERDREILSRLSKL
jgi:hypothetical protein